MQCSLNVKNKSNILVEISFIFLSPEGFTVCSYKGQMEVEYEEVYTYNL